MALDETQRKTIYEGDGTVTQFAFSFVVFQPVRYRGLLFD